MSSGERMGNLFYGYSKHDEEFNWQPFQVCFNNLFELMESYEGSVDRHFSNIQVLVPDEPACKKMWGWINYKDSRNHILSDIEIEQFCIHLGRYFGFSYVGKEDKQIYYSDIYGEDVEEALTFRIINISGVNIVQLKAALCVSRFVYDASFRRVTSIWLEELKTCSDSSFESLQRMSHKILGDFFKRHNPFHYCEVISDEDYFNRVELCQDSDGKTPYQKTLFKPELQ